MLISGLAHAVVNAILKSGRDKMSGRALREAAIFFGTAIAVVFLKERLTRSELHRHRFDRPGGRRADCERLKGVHSCGVA